MATTLRVKEATRDRVAAIAARKGTSLGDVVDEALDAYERAEFWRRTREALEHPGIEAGPGWDRTVRDGLEE